LSAKPLPIGTVVKCSRLKRTHQAGRRNVAVRDALKNKAYKKVNSEEVAMSALTLAEIAEMAKAHKMTPAERRAQRVSLIMGLRSKNSTMTHEQVSSTLDEIEGREHPAAARQAKDK
jgi:hypothetical protein